MTTENGTVTAVAEEPLGDELAKDYDVGASAIEVQNLADFPEAGGSLTLPGETIGYDSVDWDGNTIYLSTPTAFAHFAEDPVLIDPPSKRFIAHVLLDDVPGEVVMANLSHQLKMYLPTGDREVDAGESVVISNETGPWTVTDVLGVEPALTGGSLDIPDVGVDGFHVAGDGTMVVGTVTDGSDAGFFRISSSSAFGLLEIGIEGVDNPGAIFGFGGGVDRINELLIQNPTDDDEFAAQIVMSSQPTGLPAVISLLSDLVSLSGGLRVGSSAGYIDIHVRSAPAAPAAGDLRFYVTNDGSDRPQLRVKNSDGTVQTVTTFTDGS